MVVGNERGGEGGEMGMEEVVLRNRKDKGESDGIEDGLGDEEV